MMLELLKQLVSIKSLSGDEAEVASAVAAFAQGAGFNVSRHLNNVYFEFGNGSPRLLLNSHIDTVPPCAGWETDPWVPTLVGDKLHGLGANDAKGCVTAILHACQRLHQEGLHSPGTVVVAITAEEENGGKNGVSSVIPLLGQLDSAIVGEPTGLSPCNAQSGMLLLRCIAHGQSGHAAHAAAQGLANAIHIASRDIAKLDSMSFEPYAGLATPAKPQVTLIKGGISANQVPDRCEFQIDLRTTPNLDHQQLVEEITKELECEVQCKSDRYLPVATGEDTAIVKACVNASGKNPYYSNTCSDWALIGNLPTVKVGPGQSSRSHQPNEFLHINELAAGVDFYCAAVENFFKEYQHGN